jgi:hypothetical protein
MTEEPIEVPSILVPILTEFRSIGKDITNIRSKHEFLHQCRTRLDEPIFKVLKELYGPIFQKFWNETTMIPIDSDRAIVFVERREHPNLEFCLQNTAYYARGFSIHIVCSKANLEFVKQICGPQLENIHLHIEWEGVGTPEEGKKDYNELLKTRRFWELFSEDYILTMETDSYLMKPIPSSIFQYDYVASKWAWLPMEPGGGGLSFRKRTMMLDICDTYLEQVEMQDSFVSEGVKVLGYTYPTIQTNMTYFTEAFCSPHAIGTHQWWTFCCDEGLPKFIEYCTIYCCELVLLN